MLKHTKRVVVITVACLFLILGVVGLVLPFLQGVLFLIIGLMLLSVYSPTIRGWVDRIAAKHPHLEQVVTKVDSFIERIIGKP